MRPIMRGTHFYNFGAPVFPSRIRKRLGRPTELHKVFEYDCVKCGVFRRTVPEGRPNKWELCIHCGQKRQVHHIGTCIQKLDGWTRVEVPRMGAQKGS